MATKKKTAKKKTTTRRRAVAKKRTTRRRRPATMQGSFMPILLGVGGALAANFVANNAQVVKLIPDPKMRALGIGALGAVIAWKAPATFKPMGIGMAVAGGAQAAIGFFPQLLPPGSTVTNGTIGRLAPSQVNQLKAALRNEQNRLNGVGNSVIMGGVGEGVIMGGMPEGVIVGGDDADMPMGMGNFG